MIIDDITSLPGRGKVLHVKLDAEPDGDIRQTWVGARVAVEHDEAGYTYTTTVLGVDAFAKLGGPAAGDTVGLLVRGAFPAAKGDNASVFANAPKWMRSHRDELVEMVARAMKVGELVSADDWRAETAITYVNERSGAGSNWESSAEDFVTAWEGDGG